MSVVSVVSVESRSAAAKVSVASSGVPVVTTGTSGDRCAVISGSSVYTPS